MTSYSQDRILCKSPIIAHKPERNRLFRFPPCFASLTTRRVEQTHDVNPMLVHCCANVVLAGQGFTLTVCHSGSTEFLTRRLTRYAKRNGQHSLTLIRTDLLDITRSRLHYLFRIRKVGPENMFSWKNPRTFEMQTKSSLVLSQV